MGKLTLYFQNMSNKNSHSPPVGAVPPVSGNFELLTKDQLAERIKISPRTVQELVNRKLIPVVRLSQRCIRFNVKHVETALAKLEVQAA